MTAVGCAVIEEISRPAFLARVRENWEYLAGQLRALSQDMALGEVRGQGLLLALELNRETGSRAVETALAHGLLINSPQPGTLRFMPALNVTWEEINQMIEILRSVIHGGL